MTYKIEDNVPVPAVGGWGKLNKLYDTLSALEVGQSFVWDMSETNMKMSSAQARIHERAGTLRIKVTTRKVEGGYRIWRVE